MLPLLGHFSRRTFIARDDENHAIKDDSLSAGSYRIKCSLLAELDPEGGPPVVLYLWARSFIDYQPVTPGRRTRDLLKRFQHLDRSGVAAGKKSVKSALLHCTAHKEGALSIFARPFRAILSTLNRDVGNNLEGFADHSLKMTLKQKTSLSSF